MDKKRAVLYARCSTGRQAEKDLSIPAQLKALRRYAEQHNYIVVAEKVDAGKSGRKLEGRDALAEILELAAQKPRSFDVILVWKFSRFMRKQDYSVILKGYLRGKGMDVISINEPIDDSPSGKFLESVISAADQLVSDQTSEDIKRGLRENAERGFYNGNRPPIGYKIVKVNIDGYKRSKLRIDSKYAPLVRRIFRMAESGAGLNKIVSTLNNEGIRTNCGNTWSTTRIHEILTNEIYTGTYVVNKFRMVNGVKVRNEPEKVLRIENFCKSLVDKTVFEKIKAQMKERSPKVTAPRLLDSDYLLSGLLVCQKCGASMVGQSAKSRRHTYYVCNTRTKKGTDICSADRIPKDDLEDFILDNICERILTPQNLKKLVKLVNQEVKKATSHRDDDLALISKQLVEVTERLDKLYNAIETGAIDQDQIGPRITERLAEKSTLEAQKIQLETDPVKQVNFEEVTSIANDLRVLLLKGEVVERRRFLRSFIEKIEVALPEITVYYRIPSSENGNKPFNGFHKEVLHFIRSAPPAIIHRQLTCVSCRVNRAARQ